MVNDVKIIRTGRIIIPVAVLNNKTEILGKFRKVASIRLGAFD